MKLNTYYMVHVEGCPNPECEDDQVCVSPDKEIAEEYADEGFIIDPVHIVPAAALQELLKAVRALTPAADKADEAVAKVEHLRMGTLTDNASPGLGIKFGQLRALRAALAAFEEAIR